MIGQIQLYGILFILIGCVMLGLAIILIWKYLRQRREQENMEEDEEEDVLKSLLG